MAVILKMGEHGDKAVDATNLPEREALAKTALPELAKLDAQNYHRLFQEQADEFGDAPPEIRRYLEAMRDNPDDPLIIADRINQYVNKSMRATAGAYEDDAIPTELHDALSITKGDCDDFAMQKMAMLQKAGFPPEKMFFVNAEVTYTNPDVRDGHAFVVVEIEGEFYLLDNNFDDLVKLDENGFAQGYRNEYEGIFSARVVGTTNIGTVQINEVFFVVPGDPNADPIINPDPDLPDPSTGTYKGLMRLVDNYLDSLEPEKNTPNVTAESAASFTAPAPG